MGSALFRCSFGDDRGAGVQQSHEVDPHVGRMCPFELLFVDQLFHRGRAAAACVYGPVHAGVAGVEEASLPPRVEGAPSRPVGRMWSGWQGGQVVGQPTAQLGPEGRLGLGVAQVHFSDGRDGQVRSRS